MFANYSPSCCIPILDGFVVLTCVLLDQQTRTDGYREQPEGFLCVPAVRSLLSFHMVLHTVQPAVARAHARIGTAV